jgi:hypothetical protein
MEERLDRIENKLDMLIKITSEDVKNNCEKMGEHIDFIEIVYNNVKNPLGYICNKINFLAAATNYNEIENIEVKDIEAEDSNIEAEDSNIEAEDSNIEADIF